VTIYSHHASRGKVQILATYRGPAGVVSATVTSVDELKLAVPIVDALNRISACATVPVSVYDERDDRFAHYPDAHLAALSDRNVRPSLLEGAHSLWYEHAMGLLHWALMDLDTAVAGVPVPVRTAINAELEVEAHGLRDELAEYVENIEPQEPEKRRLWDFESPFVDLNGVEFELSQVSRDTLNGVELGLDHVEIVQAAANLRLLLAAQLQCTGNWVELLADGLEISEDPHDEDEDRYYLNVQAPMPRGKWGRTSWSVELGRWVPDGAQPEDGSNLKGEPVLKCGRTEPPALSEILELFKRSDGRSDVLAAWAKTPVGEPLAGTAFVVTKRYED
jgi:hypothetical protein